MQNSSKFLIIYIVQLQHGVKEPKRYSWSLQPGEGHGFIPSELLCQRLATLDRGALVYQNSAQPRHHIKVLCASTWSYAFIGLDKMRSFQWIQCGEEALLLWQNGRGQYYCADGNSCESNGGKTQYSPVWSHQKIDYAGWPWIILNLRRYFADGVGLLPPLAQQSQLLHSRPLGASPRHEGLAQSHNQDLGAGDLGYPWVIWSREMRDRMTRYDLMSIHVNKGWCTTVFSVVRNIIWILDAKSDPLSTPMVWVKRVEQTKRWLRLMW